MEKQKSEFITDYGDPLSEECYEACNDDMKNHHDGDADSDLHSLCRMKGCHCYCHSNVVEIETLWENPKTKGDVVVKVIE